MIASLTGTVISRAHGVLVLEVNGVGYRLFVPADTSASATVGDETSLHTHLVVREDSLTLYGFESEESLGVFETLLSVNGVGPKSALAVISSTSVHDIIAAVRAENAKVFQAVSGIGPKTAKLMLVSLAGKFDHLQLAETAAESGASGDLNALHAQVIQGLIGLGWPEKDSAEAVNDAVQSGVGDDAQMLLRAALKLLQNPTPGGGR